MYQLLFLVLFVSSYKILVFSPTISRSHMISNGRIADELAKAGHEVVLFEPDILNIFESVQTAKVARRWPVKGFNDDLLNLIGALSRDLFEDPGLLEMNRVNRAYHAAIDAMCKQLIEDDHLMNQLRSEKFNAFFGEHINLCGHGLAFQLDIPIHFWVSSCPVFETITLFTGMPSPFSYIPSEGMTLSSSVSPTYFERIWNIVYGLNGYLMALYDHGRTTRVFREKFGSNFPNIGEIAGSSDIVFVSTDEFIEIPRPVMPNMVNIGGLGETQSGQLDETFKKIVQMSGKGIIYFSLGTVVNTTLISKTVIENLVKVAQAFPDYILLLRVDSYDEYACRLAKDVQNMCVHDWVPQPALLSHPKIRLFITHGGYNGIMEAARAGVPLLTIPFMWDQPKNSLAVTRNGWGLSINRRVLRDDPGKLLTTVGELLNNEKYQKAAKRIQNLIKTKPFNASEKLIKTTEFVLANGGIKELLADGRQQSFMIANSLDIIVPLCLIVYLLSLWLVLRANKRGVKPKTE